MITLVLLKLGVWFLLVLFFNSDMSLCLLLGVFCCGPASVKAIRDKRVDLYYDIPFVYAEVNADVHTVIAHQGQVVSYTVDTKRVGSLICTKAIGSPVPQNITKDYKYTKGILFCSTLLYSILLYTNC